jgi:hypothetical protein
MKKLLKTRLKAMEAVLGVCLEYPMVIMLILALENAVTSLGLKIQSIIATEGKQQMNNKGVTLTKKQLKKIMLNMGKGIASAIQAYSKTISDRTLFEKMRFPKGIYMAGSAENAISACRNIYEIVSAIPALERDKFGVSDAVLLSFKNTTDDFETKGAPSTRKVIVKKTALTKMLDILTGEGNEIMRNEILKLAEQLQEEHPEFYIEVNQAAKLIEGNTHTKIRIEGKDDVTGLVMPGMNVHVQETGQKGITNTKGLCVIYLESGTYHLELTKENYITMTLVVEVIRGSNTVHAKLVPSFTIPSVVPQNVNS